MPVVERAPELSEDLLRAIEDVFCDGSDGRVSERRGCKVAARVASAFLP